MAYRLLLLGELVKEHTLGGLKPLNFYPKKRKLWHTSFPLWVKKKYIKLHQQENDTEGKATLPEVL